MRPRKRRWSLLVTAQTGADVCCIDVVVHALQVLRLQCRLRGEVLAWRVHPTISQHEHPQRFKMHGCVHYCSSAWFRPYDVLPEERQFGAWCMHFYWRYPLTNALFADTMLASPHPYCERCPLLRAGWLLLRCRLPLKDTAQTERTGQFKFVLESFGL